MVRLIAARLVQFIIIALALLTVLFFLLRLSGDPAQLHLGVNAPKEALEALREQLGLNRPLHVQYFDFMGHVLPHRSEGKFGFLDFGLSLKTPIPARDLTFERFPLTLALGGAAFAIAVTLSIPFAIVTTFSHNGAVRAVVTLIALIGQTVPNFVLAIFLIFLFGVYWDVLPIFGFKGWQSVVLPAVALAAFPLARLTRLLRSQILETLPQDYVRTAHAKGLAGTVVAFRHVLRNALLPWVTVLGLDFGTLMGGSLIVETVFAYPGLGQQVILALNQRDFPVVQAAVFLIAIVVVFGNLLADISYRWLDPRVRNVV